MKNPIFDFLGRSLEAGDLFIFADGKFSRKKVFVLEGFFVSGGRIVISCFGLSGEDEAAWTSGFYLERCFIPLLFLSPHLPYHDMRLIKVEHGLLYIHRPDIAPLVQKSIEIISNIRSKL